MILKATALTLTTALALAGCTYNTGAPNRPANGVLLIFDFNIKVFPRNLLFKRINNSQQFHRIKTVFIVVRDP